MFAKHVTQEHMGYESQSRMADSTPEMVGWLAAWFAGWLVDGWLVDGGF